MEELLQLHVVIPEEVPDEAHSEIDGGYDDVHDLIVSRFPVPNTDVPSYDHLGTTVSSSLFERRPDNMELVTEIRTQLKEWYQDASVFRSSYDHSFGEFRSPADPDTHLLLLVTNQDVEEPTIRWAVQKETLQASPLVLGDDIIHANSAGIFAIDSISGDTHWKNTSSHAMQVPVGNDDQIITNTGHELIAINRETGDVQWQTEFDLSSDEIIDSRVTLSDDKAYVGLRTGAVIAVSLDTGDPTVLCECDDAVVRLQLIEPGLLAVTNVGEVYLVSSAGISAWPENADLSLNIKHAESGCLYASAGSSLLAISENDGAIKWELDLSPVVSIAQSEDTLIATTRDSVVGINARTGNQTWENTLSDEFGSISIPVVANGVAACVSSQTMINEEVHPCDKNILHLFDPADGTEIQQFELGAGNCYAPAAVGDAIVVNAGGELVCIENLPVPS